ncbi:helix-hairpin-helix domain-containing protein [Enhygromyxa salina]|uniref:helix-hairpin-helix domain-containing protein n=1 Tax=Enhygromyxa salina TaxID=215803 RepID=UPI0011B250DC|nr:helix-hairpin-helix domain-containing protein [Enhygromyxa salina]
MLVLALLVPAEALAIEYEVFIDVDTEEELYDLYITDQISEDTFNTLVELRRRGIDLNEAGREQLYSLPNLNYDDVDAILAYREEAGVIHAPGDLAAAGVISREKLASLLTFIQAHDKRQKLTATHGWVRYQTAWSQEDRTIPPMTLQARITTLRQLTIGAAGLVTRQRPGSPVWDPSREAMVAPEMTPRVNVPKYFVQWDTDRFGVIAGSYRIGFGQRLTFDSTNRYTPNGFYLDDAVYRPTDLGVRCRESAGEQPSSPCSGAAGSTYGTKDFRWRDSQRGVAIGAKHVSLPVGWLQLYGFGSWQTKQIYQYEIFDNNVCDDPRSSDEVCSAPDVFVSREGQSQLAPASTHKFQTLPNMYDEFLAGGNFSWFYDRRTHVGVTGYGATALWRVEGPDLDFQEWSSTPFGGSWGAIGADMAWGRGWSDLGVEVARSFDSMKVVTGPDSDYGGGGYAGIIRQTSTWGSNELELSARYYDKAYANPYAGPIAQADEFDGNRARDEAGGRIRYGGRVADRLDLRALTDVWVQPSEGSPKMLTYVRGDVDVNKWFRPGLWLQYRNVDLRPNSQVGCIDDGGDLDQPPTGEQGDPTYRSGCLAEVGQITTRFGFRTLKGKLSITAQYQHEFIDDPGVDRLRQDSATTVIVRANPVKSFRIAARLRYLFEDVADNTRFEQSAWAYFDLSYVFNRMFSIRTRYDLFIWLDERASTLSRIPSPEHRLRLELEARF